MCSIPSGYSIVAFWRMIMQETLKLCYWKLNFCFLVGKIVDAAFLTSHFREFGKFVFILFLQFILAFGFFEHYC